MEAKSEWSDTYDNIKNIHDVAYRCIERAITLEENEKPLEALHTYKEGIDLIDQALNIRVSCASESDTTWDKTCNLIQKLKRARADVVTRINCLKVKHESLAEGDESPTKTGDGCTLLTYGELALALRDLSVRDFRNCETSIIYANNEAKVYYISPDGTVLSMSNYQELKIFGIEGEVPNIFLQVGNWIYPLIPGVSPCYKSEYNGFIFPDIHSNIQGNIYKGDTHQNYIVFHTKLGSSVGIIISDDADGFLYELLTNILHGVIQHEKKQRPSVTDSISSGIVTGASYLARGLVFGAENIGKLLNYSTPKLIDNINPAKENTPVPKALSQGLKITECATSKTAKVTEYVADKIGMATTKLGQFLAPHIQSQGTRILQSGFSCSEEEASYKMKGVVTVAAGAVEGFSTIYKGLEKSASILGRNLRDNTVKIVKHKYGSPVGEATMNTLNTVGNVVTISDNTAVLKPKGLVKKAARHWGDPCNRS